MLKSIKILYHQKVEESERKIVRDTINRTFTLDISEADLGIDITFAYNRLREQYNAEEILYETLNHYKERPILVIVPFDIYVPGLNFVFGLAIYGSGAIIGLERFRYGGNFRKRLEKTVKHELGHVFGLSHCNKPCVMRFANSLWELDIKPEDFCPACAARLRGMGILKAKK